MAQLTKAKNENACTYICDVRPTRLGVIIEIETNFIAPVCKYPCKASAKQSNIEYQTHASAPQQNTVRLKD